MPPQQQQRRSTVYCCLWKLFERASIQENEEVDPTSKIYILDPGLGHSPTGRVGTCACVRPRILYCIQRNDRHQGLARGLCGRNGSRGAAKPHSKGRSKNLPCITSHFVRVCRTNASCAWGGTAHWQGPWQKAPSHTNTRKVSECKSQKVR